MFSTWIGFAMMCIGMFMAILDVQVVATSLPTIQSALAIPPDQMSWVQTAYLIAEVIAIPLTGFLTRLLSMRWLFVMSIVAFTLTSLGCAASNNFSELIAFRVLQGFSGGTLIPAVFSAVFLLFPVKRQNIATMLAGVLAVLAPTVGPIVGGWITDTYFLALAIFDQHHSRHSVGDCRQCLIAEIAHVPPRGPHARLPITGPDRDGLGDTGTCAQGRATARMDVWPCNRTADPERNQHNRLYPSHHPRPPPDP